MWTNFVNYFIFLAFFFFSFYLLLTVLLYSNLWFQVILCVGGQVGSQKNWLTGWALFHLTLQSLTSARVNCIMGRQQELWCQVLEGKATRRCLPEASGRLPRGNCRLVYTASQQGADQRLGAYICLPTSGLLLLPPHIRQVLQPRINWMIRGQKGPAATGRGGRSPY